MRVLSLVKTGLDLVFPRMCLGCETALTEDGTMGVCSSCWDSLSMIGQDYCPKCGAYVGPYAHTPTRCASCRGFALFFTRATAPCRYEGVVRDLILTFKYEQRTAALYPLSSLLVGHLRGMPFMRQIDLIVPVPLYWKRFLQRGFNQSEMLAVQIHRAFSIPVDTRLLKRTRPTPPQTALSASERRKNLLGAFAVAPNRDIKGKTVLLCDDVMTTCSTAIECSRMLKRAQAGQIYVATVAR